jgi:hypothetical protein
VAGATTTFTIITQTPTPSPAHLAEGGTSNTNDSTISTYFVASTSSKDVAGIFGIDLGNRGLCTSYAAGLALFAEESDSGRIDFESQGIINDGVPILATLNTDNSINLFDVDNNPIIPRICGSVLSFGGDPDVCSDVDLFAVPISTALTTTTVTTVTSTSTIKPTPTCTNVNGVANSGFESGSIDPWNVYNQYGQNVSVVQDGYNSTRAYQASFNSSSVYVTSAASTINQTITTVPGVNYTVSINFKFDSLDSGYSSVTLAVGNSRFNNIFPSTAKLWTTYSVVYTAATANALVAVRLQLKSDQVITVDNIVAVANEATCGT